MTRMGLDQDGAEGARVGSLGAGARNPSHRQLVARSSSRERRPGPSSLAARCCSSRAASGAGRLCVWATSG
eukprot:7211744-Alexandrium_andersonii.AAC.1